jgi:hypothetical protein
MAKKIILISVRISIKKSKEIDRAFVRMNWKFILNRKLL